MIFWYESKFNNFFVYSYNKCLCYFNLNLVVWWFLCISIFKNIKIGIDGIRKFFKRVVVDIMKS